MKIEINCHPADPFSHDARLAQMFQAAKWAAELWMDSSRRPNLPQWCSYIDTDVAAGEPSITVANGSIKYITASGYGKYVWTPTSWSFEGRRRSLYDGCLLCGCELIFKCAEPRADGFIYPEDAPPRIADNLIRCDIVVTAPIGPDGLIVYHGEFYYVCCYTSAPDKIFE